MSDRWIDSMFGTKKPIIAMCHLNALPGDTGYDKQKGIGEIVEWAIKDVRALQNGGVDAIMFSNEFSLPYMTKVPAITVATMARIIGEIFTNIKVPFGVNVLWDPVASIDLAVATGAVFVREVFSGVYAGDFGLWNLDFGKTARHQHAIAGEGIKLFFNIYPEGAKYLAGRDITSIAQSTEFNARPDAICVSGLTAGAETDASVLNNAKAGLRNGTPLFANTGVRLENVEEQLSIADGAVVGTVFKKDGKFENHVDEKRVDQFMTRVRSLRT